jgi:ADP-ribose pyrophosphatase YjhB (NUDIX family)
MSDDARQVLGVSGVVCDRDGHILLIRTEKVGWELPGGRVEPGEDILAALQREVREEARCEVEVGRLTGVTSHVAAPDMTLLTFLCRYTGGDPCPGDDSLEVGWFAPDTAVRLVTHPVEQVRLKDALGEDQGVNYRAYRRLPGEGPQRNNFEMLLLHHC